MKHIKYFLVGFLFLIPFLNADAATYYVDSSCALSGNGSSQTCATANGGVGAFNSLAKVKAKVGGYTAGDAVLFKRDQTFPLGTLTSGFIINWSGTLGNPITFGDYGTGAKPIINATGAIRGFDLQNVSNISIQNLKIQNATTTNVLLRANPKLENVTFDGVDISGGGGITFNTPTLVSNLTFKNGTVENTNTGFLLSVGSTQNVSNIIFDTMTFKNNTNAGLQISGNKSINGVHILNSTFTQNGGHGFSLGSIINSVIDNTTSSGNGFTGGYIFGANNTTARANTITVSDFTSSGNGLSSTTLREGLLFGSNVSNATVSDSTFVNNKGNGFGVNGGNTSGITVVNTTATTNENDGFNISGSASTIVFDHCLADSNGLGTGTTGDGFSFHQTSSGTIKYSVSKNNTKSAAAHVNNSSVAMYYNIFSHDTNGAIGLVTLAGATTGIPSNHTLYNNIFYSGVSGSGYGLHMYGGGTGLLNVTLNNNAFSGFDTAINRTNGNLTEDNNIVYNFSTAAIAGQSFETNSLISDPLFTNPSIGDFTSTLASPMVDAGVVVGISTDYAGNPIIGTPDIGIYEIF